MKNCSRVPVANGETKFLGDRVPCREAEYFYQVPIRRYHGSTDVEPKGRLGSRAPPKVTVDVARDDLWTPTAVRHQRWPSMSPATTSGRRPCRTLTVGPECPRGLRAQLYASHMSAVLNASTPKMLDDPHPDPPQSAIQAAKVSRRNQHLFYRPPQRGRAATPFCCTNTKNALSCGSASSGGSPRSALPLRSRGDAYSDAGVMKASDGFMQLDV